MLYLLFFLSSQILAAPNIQEREQIEKGKPGAKNQIDAELLLVKEELVANIDQAIKHIESSLKQFPPRSSTRFKLYLRLLNLKLEQASYLAAREQRSYDKRWEQWEKNGRKGPSPKPSYRQSRSLWDQVQKLAKQILREYPKDKRIARVLYSAALALQFLDRKQEAANMLQEVVTRFPRSQSAARAFYRLGEYNFSLNRFAQAQQFYKQVLKFKQHDLYGWAKFKIGWCQYNNNQIARSLKTWQQTVSLAKNNQRLRDEVLRDLVYPFSDLNRTQEALAYYRKYGNPEHLVRFYRHLAQRLSFQGKFAEARKMWQQLRQDFPSDISAHQAQLQIVALSSELQDFPRLWRELDKLQAAFSPQSLWGQENPKENPSPKNQEMAAYYPKLWHKRAQEKTRFAAKYRAQALIGYRLFLKYYGKQEQGPEFKELAADLEFRAKNYPAAGQLYLEIGKVGKQQAIIKGQKGKVTNIHKRTAQNMLESFSRALSPELSKNIKKKPNFEAAAIPLSTNAKNFIEGCKHYLNWYPNGKLKKNCYQYSSEIYYRNQHREKALRYLWLLASTYPKSKEGKKAAENIIPFYQDNKTSLQQSAARLYKIPALRTGKIGKKLKDLLRGLKLENLSQENPSAKRATKFIAAAKADPKAKDADKLWFNAAVDYLKSANPRAAINSYLQLLQRYPKSSLKQNSRLQLGKIYETLADLPEAAKFYLAAKKEPKAWFRACRLLIATNNTRATKVCRNFARKHPNGAQAALEALIQNLEDRGKIREMQEIITKDYLRLKISRNQKAIAYYRIYRKNKKYGREITRLQGLSGQALRYKAAVIFQDIQKEQRRLKQRRLQGGSVERLQKSLEGFSRAIQKLEKSYQRLFATKEAYWGTAGLFQLGEAYSYFVAQLNPPPHIPGIKTQDLATQLKGTVTQLKTQAANYYASAAQSRTSFKVASQWGLKVKAKEQRQDFLLLVPEPDFVSSRMDSTTTEAALK